MSYTYARECYITLRAGTCSHLIPLDPQLCFHTSYYINCTLIKYAYLTCSLVSSCVLYRYHGKGEKAPVGPVQHRTGSHTDQREDIRGHNELPGKL